MSWLRSRASQVLPPSSERYRPFLGTAASINAYTTLGLDGATVTATRPHGFAGKPFAAFASNSVHDAPPSVLLKRPEPLGASGPLPPERNVHPCRRKSHIPAAIVSGFFGSIVMAPMDWTGCLSKTGLKVVPPLTDFQTPPLAAPA